MSTLALAAAVLASVARAAPARPCAPPAGPGDGAVHSARLRVTGIDCVQGRRVAVACVRFTYGRAGTCRVLGYRWRCASTKAVGSESAQRCSAGDRLMTIRWLD